MWSLCLVSLDTVLLVSIADDGLVHANNYNVVLICATVIVTVCCSKQH